MAKYKNIFYFNHINKIGGIETFFYQLAKIYSEDNDITIFYKTADEKQLKRLKKLVRCVRWKNEEIECEKAFFNFNLDAIDKIKADEYIQMLHGDYKAMGIKPNMHPKINKYISVSETVQKSFKEITGIDSELIYNPIEVEEPKKVLFLISATRLTYEKGKERIIKLASKLDNDNIPYLWLIFTDNTNEIVNPNVIYMKPRLNIIDYIKKADYLVQLSNAEGYCYSVVEALSVGTPVIVTNMPVMSEIGVNKDNGFILDFNLSNVDTKAIYEKEFNFKYEPPKSEWQKELIKSKSNYKEELKMKYLVEALNTYEERKIEDGVFKRILKAGEQFEVDKERLDVLLGDNTYKVAFVKLVKEIKEELIEDEEVDKMEEGTKKKTTKKKTTTKKKVAKKK
jgi:glycosyltransferase involved in cell wall biosynthesis